MNELNLQADAVYGGVAIVAGVLLWLVRKARLRVTDIRIEIKGGENSRHEKNKDAD